jgi:pyridoxal phosphate enzyme (YggS family)
MNAIDRIRENLGSIQQRVVDAAETSGRNPNEISLVAVTKYVGADLTAAAIAAGCTVIGENRPQAIWEKHAALPAELEKLGCSSAEFEIHIIGHLQRNKVRRTLPLVGLFQSVDSMRLAEAIESEAENLGQVVDVLLEVNVTPDESKTGLLPSELAAVFDFCWTSKFINPRGLMGMARIASREDDDRDFVEADPRRDFEQIRLLRDELRIRCNDSISLPELSMGMSGDFCDAIAEGSTIIRVGSSLYQGLLA